ncbi:SDR family oxidoreductase [Oleiharenicola lentus]|uniref:SDR family oxidoreductase n=1 Tax=Oleiharenicola lentus TaxID=2508720 RepID=UPI003F67D1A2
MKILVTGASGLLGAAVVRVAARVGHEVLAVVGGWKGEVPHAARTFSINLESADATRALEREEFDVLINCAAVAEPTVCVTQPERSQRLNVEMPAQLAAICAQRGARMIHLSSEQVYDGEHAPFSVKAAPAPLNLYGRQKVAGEQAVAAACVNSASVRSPLLLGNSLGGHRSVHEKFFETLAAGKKMKLYRDEIRQVCTADNMAEALVELAGREDLRGVFNWAGAEPISRWDLGLKTAAHFGVDAALEPITRADTPEVSATRPRDLTLNLAPLELELKTRPETVDEAVAKLLIPEWWKAR